MLPFVSENCINLQVGTQYSICSLNICCSTFIAIQLSDFVLIGKM